MGDLRKPQCPKERRSFFPRPSPIRRIAFCGTFVLILWLVVITGIPQALGASSLYLPLILKPPICDPAMTLTSGNNQIIFGTPGDDHICEFGFGSNVTQYAEGAAGNDTIYQDCRGADTCNQTVRLGDGNDTVTQYGGKGNSSIYAEGGAGNQIYNQFGGSGDDTLMVQAGTGNSRITQTGGPGKDILEVLGSTGDDNITINAGEGNDTITYNVTAGIDVVRIDGGPGDDKLTVPKNQQNVTILSETDMVGQVATNGSYLTDPGAT